ncbi:S-adenosyl-L-methionine-dependent methyltransferase [Fistulina hepatica ATCC 64428]|nr:S-adenosyl-L-methionine-dependent methyltransferase [Fistulina hepatica ATCC 64428]
MSKAVHSTAQNGFATGKSDFYDKQVLVRPSYHPEPISYIRKALPLPPPFSVAEIGCGTGLFTRALLSHPEWATDIAQIHAIEPIEGMRTTFAAKVSDSRVVLHDGTFDSTGVEDSSVDIIIMAQAFHWCPDFNKAFIEFARILKPNGIVAMIWNSTDVSVPWINQIRELLTPQRGDNPQFLLMHWKEGLSTPAFREYFYSKEETTIVHPPKPATIEAVLDMMCSVSYMTILPADEKERMRHQMRGIIEKGEGLIWLDKDKGIFEAPSQTYVMTARKK